MRPRVGPSLLATKCPRHGPAPSLSPSLRVVLDNRTLVAPDADADADADALKSCQLSLCEQGKRADIEPPPPPPLLIPPHHSRSLARKRAGLQGLGVGEHFGEHFQFSGVPYYEMTPLPLGHPRSSSHCAATSTLFWTIYHAFSSSTPPHARRVLCFTV